VKPENIIKLKHYSISIMDWAVTKTSSLLYKTTFLTYHAYPT